MTDQAVFESVTAAMVFIALFAVVVYLGALAMASFLAGKQGSLGGQLRDWFMSAPAMNIGLPCSALGAFALVAALNKVFKTDGQGDQVVMKLFGLAFSGPSGPVTLWIMSFLALVAAMRLLRR